MSVSPPSGGKGGRPLRRELLDTGFGDDDGRVAPDVADALAAYEGERSTHRETLLVLQDARLLVPVVAVVGEVEHDSAGLARDKTSDMATVLMTSRSGRTALMAFTCLDTMRRWRPDSRPVPVSVPQAAQAALQDGAQALLLDVAGPVMFVVERRDLEALAEGFRLVPMAGKLAWAKAVAADDDRG